MTAAATLLLGALLIMSLVPVTAAAQALNSGTARTDLNSGQKPKGFNKHYPVAPKDCHLIGVHGIKFCPKGTEWTRESELKRDTPPYHAALYQIDENRKAAITSVFMKWQVSSTLTPAQLAAVVERHAFTDAARGPRERTRLLSEKRTTNGKLHMQSVLATGRDGTQEVLQIYVSRMQYGVGIFETTQPVTDALIAAETSDAPRALLNDFIAASRLVVTVGTGRN